MFSANQEHKDTLKELEDKFFEEKVARSFGFQFNLVDLSHFMLAFIWSICETK